MIFLRWSRDAYQIWVLFEIHRSKMGASETVFVESTCWSSTLPHSHLPTLFYIIEVVKYIQMDLYSIIRSMLWRSPPGKWVLFVRTVEYSFKKSDLFTGVWWRDPPQGQVVHYVLLIYPTWTTNRPPTPLTLLLYISYIYHPSSRRPLPPFPQPHIIL